MDDQPLFPDERAPTALAVVPAATLPAIIAADKDDILKKLSEKVAAFKPDISTPAGRKAVASMAYEVATSKQALIRIGKGLTEGWRTSTAAVNAECKVIEERMDALRDQIRKPLDEWETKAKAKVAEHERLIGLLQGLAQIRFDADVLAIDCAISELGNIYANRDWEEFQARADLAYETSSATLSRLRVATFAREIQAIELARLKAEEEKRQQEAAILAQQAREDQIRADAEARAKLEAEVKAAETARLAEEERQRVIDELAAEQKRAAQAAADAEAEIERQKVAAAEAEKRTQEIAAQAEKDRIAAEAAAAEAQAEAARQIETARVEADRRPELARVEAVAEGERQVAAALARAEATRAALDRDAAAAQAEREADVAHRRTINRAAADVILLILEEPLGGVPEMNEAIAANVAKAIISAIARGAIPHVTIKY